MASLHRQHNRPNWFCAFTTPSGTRYFKSTGTSNKQLAQKICNGWVKAGELAAQKNLTADRARKLIEGTVFDVAEANAQGSISTKTLKNFFKQAADLVEQQKFSRESLNVLVSGTVKEVAAKSGEVIPDSSVRDWCDSWLKTKALESAPRTHERYKLSIDRFLKSIKEKAERDLTALRPDDILRFRDQTAGALSAASANMDLKVVRACLYAAQRQELSFHSFRHTLTTWLKSSGASNALAQMIIGHDSEVVSRGYTHLSADDTKDSIGKLPDVTK